MFQKRVKKSVETMTGLKVSAVNVHVQGVKTDIDDTKDTQNPSSEA